MGVWEKIVSENPRFNRSSIKNSELFIKTLICCQRHYYQITNPSIFKNCTDLADLQTL